MRLTDRSVARLAAAVACLIPLCAAALDAHDRKAAGALTLVLGWSSEPAFAGSMNGVVVAVSDRSGPLAKIDGALTVEITFGSEHITLPLERGLERPHEFHAALVPTRAGTYSFHVTGRINNQPIAISSTCGEGTFHCVIEPATIQFPVKDPSVGELAARIERSLPRGDAAARAAGSARITALAAIAISIVAAGIAIAAGIRAARKAA